MAIKYHVASMEIKKQQITIKPFKLDGDRGNIQF